MATARNVGARSKHASAGANCSSSCLTKDHGSFGECLRFKNLKLSPRINDGYQARQGAWDKELDNYDSAVRQGLSPAGTKQHHIDAALKEAEA